MAERKEGSEVVCEKSLGASISSGELTKTNPPLDSGGKSPGKTRKVKKGLLFKKSAHDDSSPARSSGKGKRKGGRGEKKVDSRDPLEEIQPPAPEIPQSPPTEANYDINSQEEQKSAVDLPAKKVQKLNKELAKQNTHLVKSVDVLKKEKELLISDRVKLKSENKSLEKELKRFSSKDRLTQKMSLPPPEEASYDADLLKEKIQLLEDQLSERDHVAMLLKMKMDKSHPEIVDTSELDEVERAVNVRIKNGSVLDPSLALEMFLDEQDTSLKLRRENSELKSRISVLETDLENYRMQREGSPKTPRKRSSGLFKRGKKSTSSLKNASEESQLKTEYTRSQSPDILLKSDSHHEQLDVSIPPLLTRSNKDSTISLPCYASPNQSPHLPAKNRAHAETITLLKLAIEEKNAFEENNARLEKELDGAKCKIAELEESITALEGKTGEEINQLKNNLKVAEIERDTFCSELKIVQCEVDEMVEKNDSMDRMYAESLGKKNQQIRELEGEIDEMIEKIDELDGIYTQALSEKNKLINELEQETKKSNAVSPSHNAKPGVTASPKKQANAAPVQEKTTIPVVYQPNSASTSPPVVPNSAFTSPPVVYQPNSASTIPPVVYQPNSSSTIPPVVYQPTSTIPPVVYQPNSASTIPPVVYQPNSATSDKKSGDSAVFSGSDKTSSPGPKQTSSERIRERHGSVESPKHEKVSKLVREKSQGKLVKNVPPSPSRKVGRLSRESSMDLFEAPTKRKNSSSGVPESSVNFAKVSTTRAMFEQRIGENKTEQSSSKWSSKSAERRKSMSSSEATTKDTVQPQHSKSSSFENATKQSPTQQRGSVTKDAVQPRHSKSGSIDASPKQSCAQQKGSGTKDTVQLQHSPVDHATTKQSPTQQKKPGTSTGSGDKAKLVSPAPMRELPNGPSESSNEANNKINHKQQEKPHSGAATAAVKKSSVSKTSENLPKVTKIILSSTASPVLSNRKDITQSSSRDLYSPSSTSPSLTSSDKSVSTSSTSTTNTTRGQGSQATTKVSTVRTTVRHSSPTKTPTAGDITPKMHAAVTKSLTESKIPASSGNRNSVVWSGYSYSPQVATTTASTPSTTNRVVVKTSSRLGDDLLSPMNKSSSFQNIPAETSNNIEGSRSPDNAIKVSTTSSSSSSSSSSRVRQGPTHKALLRRERKDRPKTMYAGRAETTNLMNLISKFQESDKEQFKEVKTFAAPGLSPPAAVSPSKLNGTSSPGVASPSPASSTHTFSSNVAPAVTLRQSTTPKDRQGLSRPTSYCGSNNLSKPGLGFQAPPSYSSKPLPHERILQRSRTVAVGLGSTTKHSKKAMLLKWCQFITQDYDNVNICNFAESFSNGLAFCAMMHHFLPEQIPFNTLKPADRENNFKLAFKTAEGAGIPALLDVEDMVSLPKPDWMSVMTYISFIYNKFGQQSQQQLQQQLHSSMV